MKVDILLRCYMGVDKLVGVYQFAIGVYDGVGVNETAFHLCSSVVSIFDIFCSVLPHDFPELGK